MNELIKDDICPACGGDLTHWNQEIYECEDCGTMIPLDEDEN